MIMLSKEIKQQNQKIKLAYELSGYGYEDEVIGKLQQNKLCGQSLLLINTKKNPYSDGPGDCDFITWLHGDGFSKNWGLFIFWQAKRAKDKVMLLESIHQDYFQNRGTYEKDKDIKPNNDKKDLYHAIEQLNQFQLTDTQLGNLFECGSSDFGCKKRISAIITEADMYDYRGTSQLTQSYFQLNEGKNSLYLVNKISGIKKFFLGIIRVNK